MFKSVLFANSSGLFNGIESGKEASEFAAQCMETLLKATENTEVTTVRRSNAPPLIRVFDPVTKAGELYLLKGRVFSGIENLYFSHTPEAAERARTACVTEAKKLADLASKDGATEAEIAEMPERLGEALAFAMINNNDQDGAPDVLRIYILNAAAVKTLRDSDTKVLQTSRAGKWLFNTFSGQDYEKTALAEINAAGGRVLEYRTTSL